MTKIKTFPLDNPSRNEMKWNESGFRPPLCTYRLNWARRTSEMIEMTLSSRHRVRNSSPGGLRPSTLPLGHGGSPQYWLSHVDGEETFFVSFKSPRPGTEPRTLAWKAAVLTATLGPPPNPSRTIHKWSLVKHEIRRVYIWSSTAGPESQTVAQHCYSTGLMSPLAGWCIKGLHSAPQRWNLDILTENKPVCNRIINSQRITWILCLGCDVPVFWDNPCNDGTTRNLEITPVTRERPDILR